MTPLDGPSRTLRPRVARRSTVAASVAVPACLASLLALTLAMLPPAVAQLSDRESPTTVESDRMQYDDRTQVNTFIGNVVLNRGTLQIRSDRMVLRQEADGFQTGTATGRPVTFRQKREGVDEWIQGQAEELVYDGRKETMRLLRQARVWRTQGARTVDEIEGALIVYDLAAERVEVEGAGADAPGGRVRVTIQPRAPDGPTSAGPGAAGATPGAAGRERPAAATPLRPALPGARQPAGAR
jgi:lipopolysaccharide export system protein LptA